MPKRIDFAKQRRDQGRSLTSAVREIKAIMEPIANPPSIFEQSWVKRQHKKEREAAINQTPARIRCAFVYLSGWAARQSWLLRPRALGFGFYAFTAAHVIRDSGSAKLFAPSGRRGGKLQPLPPYTAHLRSSRGNNDVDAGVLALTPCFLV
jgi:hypothetical protein